MGMAPDPDDGARLPADGEHRDYTGAVYGSLLAASVVAGAGTLGRFPRIEMIILLVGTGAVFWAAHVYAHLFGARMVFQTMNMADVRKACAEEWPIVKATVPPAVAVAVGPLLGLESQGTVWLALAVAVAGQVGWAAAAAVEIGASSRMVLVTSVVNLLLGLVIVALKAAFHH
ncbi:hypothetical protein [Planomonospora parontospora]|uniref:hypothetical protein n=1 Tax=Planomonospora parontospora TaxID=58119 RepID=UPI0019437C49|nr:hypothetical protein [Planomonospora parontospora]GGL15187.1 hypothetical protein GCM10014719_16550 [Planomonospora parontospora subsp. antibiotica]GII15929.1 hypothetical protein Ppa05_26550 [Planomonospora parontospora subsp. antibiotica]